MTRPFAPKDAEGYYLTSANVRSHFHETECVCRCGCGNSTMDQATIDMMEAIRALFGAPMHVNSAVRCETYNKRIDGAKTSQHLPRFQSGAVAPGRGGVGGGSRACDFTFKGFKPDKVYRVCDEAAKGLGIKGLGRYAGFTHADTRTGKVARW